MLKKILTVFIEVFLGSSGLLMIPVNCLHIFGLWGIFRKCGVKPWKALIPFVREYNLALCADHEMEGRTLAVMSVLTTVSNLISDGIGVNFPKVVVLLFGSLTIAMLVVTLVYTIRVSLGMCEIFGRRKRWLWLWILASSLTEAIWGWSKKFQPSVKVEDMREDALRLVNGTAGAEAVGEGLSIEIKERTVTEFFHKKYLLRDIAMNIHPGHMVLLLGGSGAGKTTFLNAVNGYEKAKAKVMLNGKDIYSDYKKMQYQIGFVNQQNLIRGKDTIMHTMDDAALLRLPTNVPEQDRKDRENEVLDIFGLGPSKHNHVEKLSGGQLRRLSISMEFVSNPSLFILDEPDSGLDGVMARDLMKELRAIANQGKIVIVITHTPDRVIDLFDDVIVLAKDSHRTGRLAFFGSIEDARKFFGRNSMELIVRAINPKDAGGEGLADEYIRKYAEVCNG
ncbi:MAG: ATP-binding cassette domain-containing protein [Spirochaetales bacterium]|nr:ATP-binding cassette domain-containing protein [Spirochaetales bacterium]